MHLTVGVGPPRSAEPDDLQSGLRLARAALLYGDAVSLCSPTASLLLHLRADAPRATGARLERLAALADDLGLDDAPARLAHALATGETSEADARATVHAWWRHYRQALGVTLQHSGLDELGAAVRAGRLTIETLGLATGAPVAGLAEAAAETYAAAILAAVARGDTTPLLDDATADELRGALDAPGCVSEPRRVRARAGGLAAHVLQQLPLFDRATVPEVLDIRSDLDAPLARFRGAIAEFTDEIEAAPWDYDFDVEAERVYRRRVAPAVAEIEDAVASVGYLRELVGRYAERPGQFVGLAAPALSVVLGTPDAVAQAVTAALAGLSLGANAAQAGWAFADARRAVRADRLFFVYAAARRLGRRR